MLRTFPQRRLEAAVGDWGSGPETVTTHRLASVGGVDWCHFCWRPVVCVTCGTCPRHCATPGGPDVCWIEVDRYRRENTPDHEPPEKPRWPGRR
jgi:hypothetical protein